MNSKTVPQGGSEREKRRGTEEELNRLIDEFAETVETDRRDRGDVYRMLERRVLRQLSDADRHGGGSGEVNFHSTLGDLVIELTSGALADDVPSSPQWWPQLAEQALGHFAAELDAMTGEWEEHPIQMEPVVLHRFARRMRATAELSLRMRLARYDLGPNWGGSVPVEESEAAE